MPKINFIETDRTSKLGNKKYGYIELTFPEALTNREEIAKQLRNSLEQNVPNAGWFFIELLPYEQNIIRISRDLGFANEHMLKTTQQAVERYLQEYAANTKQKAA